MDSPTHLTVSVTKVYKCASTQILMILANPRTVDFTKTIIIGRFYLFLSFVFAFIRYTGTK